MMEELLPLEAYDTVQKAARSRTMWVMVVLWGVPMTLMAVLDAGSAVEAVLRLVWGVVAALLFGLLWTWVMALWMGSLQRRIYHGDPRLVPPPPAGDLEYRLACGYLASRSMTVGGHLYVGPAAWTFVPHRKNLKRHRTPTIIPVTEGMEVESVEITLPAVGRLLVPGPAFGLRVRTPSSTAMFSVPETHAVAGRLREYLGTVRHRA